MIAQLLIAVLCFAVLVGVFALIAAWTWREATRHTACHQLAERRSLKPPLAGPFPEDFARQVTSEMSFIAPPKEKP